MSFLRTGPCVTVMSVVTPPAVQPAAHLYDVWAGGAGAALRRAARLEAAAAAARAAAAGAPPEEQRRHRRGRHHQGQHYRPEGGALQQTAHYRKLPHHLKFLNFDIDAQIRLFQ